MKKNTNLNKISWHPSASIQTLRARATILSIIRQFFATRNIFEVETPLLSHATVSDPHVRGIPADVTLHNKQHTFYLQTSPEYAMKRLLAAGSGSIYQISKAFRQGDLGRYHNPEFTMLEWYQLDIDHHGLMNEMDALLQSVLQTEPAERVTYAALFKKYVELNPHLATEEELKEAVQKRIQLGSELSERNDWLDLLFTHCIEPYIAQERPLFLYDFPVSQAALAKIRQEDPPVSSRFEVYFKGIELANGFHELQDVTEQRKRFEKDLLYRDKHGLPLVPLDENFLSALEQGMPECAGVAVGVDRLVMLALGENEIAKTLSFGFERA